MANKFDTEIALVKGLQLKENAAIAHLYTHYGNALQKIISDFIKEPEVVEDVYQQCIVTIWQKISQYDSAKGRLFTWMLNICRNASIDTLRSKNYKNHQNQQTIDNVSYDVGDSIGGSTQQKIDNIGLKKIIHSLPNDLKVPLAMNYFEGYTHSEISETLGWPLGTVKTRIRAAIIELRKKMQP